LFDFYDALQPKQNSVMLDAEPTIIIQLSTTAPNTLKNKKKISLSLITSVHLPLSSRYCIKTAPGMMAFHSGRTKTQGGLHLFFNGIKYTI
jgi:hypothetical protein